MPTSGVIGTVQSVSGRKIKICKNRRTKATLEVSAADVDRRTIGLGASAEGSLGNALAVDKQPLHGTTGITGVVVLGATLRFSHPILGPPSMGFFLNEGTERMRDQGLIVSYLFLLFLLVVLVCHVTTCKEGSTGSQSTADLCKEKCYA